MAGSNRASDRENACFPAFSCGHGISTHYESTSRTACGTWPMGAAARSQSVYSKASVNELSLALVPQTH